MNNGNIECNGTNEIFMRLGRLVSNLWIHKLRDRYGELCIGKEMDPMNDVKLT